jgi:hypothetical protein
MNDKYETITDSSGASFSLDSRYFPLIICTWTGVPTLEIMQFHFERRKPHFNRALTAGTKVIQISDMSSMSSPPATIRKYSGEQGKLCDAHEAFIGYVGVVPNAVIRGVVTALQWIVGGDVKPIEFSPSIDEAIKKAAKKFETAGIDFPPITYTQPPRK